MTFWETKLLRNRNGGLSLSPLRISNKAFLNTRLPAETINQLLMRFFFILFRCSSYSYHWIGIIVISQLQLIFSIFMDYQSVQEIKIKIGRSSPFFWILTRPCYARKEKAKHCLRHIVMQTFQNSLPGVQDLPALAPSRELLVTSDTTQPS